MSQEARKVKRQGKPAYATGSPRFEQPRFDPKLVEQDVERATKNGCDFYFIPFPRESYLNSMELFAKHLMPTYSET